MNCDISIVIVTDNSRRREFARCIESIKRSKAGGAFEILVIANGDDISSEYDKLNTVDLTIRIHRIPKSSRGKTRNEGIKEASGEIVYFIDDDVVLDSGALKVIKAKFLKYPDISVLGGPNITPWDSSYFQKAVDCVLGSLWGAWKMSKRYVTGAKDMYVDDKSLILCNLCIKNSIFNAKGVRFNEHLVCNEENLLLTQLKQKGYKMLYTPELVVYHKRRSNFLEFCYQVYRSGQGRMQVTILEPGSFNALFFVPAFFALYIISLLFTSNVFFIKLFFVYLAVNLLMSAYISIKKGFVSGAPLVFLLSFLGHFSYGFGLISGILLFRKTLKSGK